MQKVPTKETIKRGTITDMKALGTYKKQYGRLIDIYSQLVFQYLTLNQKFEQDNYQVQVNSAKGGPKKAPIVATLENLRKDILAYSDRLCLNPKALENVTAEKEQKSKLASVLSSLEK
ncbi:MAG: Terminase small subunit [Oscillospiraceae bacterium]|jgi:phage terminase small subunit